jgi:hypothetical protein
VATEKCRIERGLRNKSTTVKSVSAIDRVLIANHFKEKQRQEELAREAGSKAETELVKKEKEEAKRFLFIINGKWRI